jgi:hypothetical protein
MLAPKTMPQQYFEWNAKWGAPFGRRVRPSSLPYRSIFLRWRGYFCLQPNNDTRAFEYPWAYFATPLAPGMHVIEVGGGLSGFQFVLSREGMRVTNVDPGMDAKGRGWPCDAKNMKTLNRVFGTSVQLRNSTTSEAGLEPNSYDRAYCISVIEHLCDDEIRPTLDDIYSCLKPGGLFVATFDLFLDLDPFTSRESNEWGRNYEIAKYIGETPFRVVAGNMDELYGSTTFDRDKIQSCLSRYRIGTNYPVLVQCVVLQKPEAA